MPTMIALALTMMLLASVPALAHEDYDRGFWRGYRDAYDGLLQRSFDVSSPYWFG